MRMHFAGLSPGRSPEDDARIQWIVEIWNGLSVSTDAGETIAGVLELQARGHGLSRADSTRPSSGGKTDRRGSKSNDRTRRLLTPVVAQRG